LSDSKKQKFRKDALAWMAVRFIRWVGASLRVQVKGFEQFGEHPEKLIFCGWHGNSFMFANHFRKRKFWVIISNSNDGDIQDRIFRSLGYQSIRGSTGRGGVRAALEGVRKLREGGVMAITPDGPRGPSKEVQGGVMLMAHKSGSGLVPVGIDAKSKKVFEKSWDRYFIPMPLSKAAMIFGEPIYIPEKSTEEEIEAIRLHLQNEINRLDEEATRTVNS
jgi:lysophospholipid acyltransferase (LPLAT)-like uncharacterized protein